MYVCTSKNTSPGNSIVGRFTPVVYDGYGSNYTIDKNRICISITANKSCKETDAAAFKKTIESMLVEFGQMFNSSEFIYFFKCYLCNKGNHGSSVTRIVFELLLIVLVLLNGPNVHLTSSNNVEKESYYQKKLIRYLIF